MRKPGVADPRLFQVEDRELGQTAQMDKSGVRHLRLAKG